MNDQQLETVLRSSLARHAETVTSGPSWPPTSDVITDERPPDDLFVDDELAEHRARRRGPSTWWPVAAAVVAVLVVIGVVLAVRHVTTDHSRPATPVTVTRTNCYVPLPDAWQGAVRAGDIPDAANGALLGSGPDGAVVIGTDKQILLVRPDGSSQPILNAPWNDVAPAAGGESADILSGQPVAINQRWIVVPVMTAQPGPNTDFHVKIVIVDRADLRTKREIQLPTKPDKLVVFDDHVYALYGDNGTGSVQNYDIATGTAQVLTQRAKFLAANPHGVSWTDSHDGSHVIAGQDPTAVPGHPGSLRDVVSDGPNYAWWTSTGIGWYSDETKQTVYVRDAPASWAGQAVAAVVGPYVLTFVNDAGGLRVTDTRTGAAGVIAGTGSANTGGGAIAYTGDHGTIRVDTKSLPGLHC